MAESRKSPRKVTEKQRKSAGKPEKTRWRKPENATFKSRKTGKRKEKMDANQRKAEIVRKISCQYINFPAASGSFFLSPDKKNLLENMTNRFPHLPDFTWISHTPAAR